MKARLLAAALAVLGAADGSAETPSTRIIEIIGERSTDPGEGGFSPATVARLPACGSKADGFLCGRISNAAPAFRTAPLAVTAPLGSTVVVSWSATVSCELAGQAAGQGGRARIDFAVDLGLQDGATKPMAPGEEGSARIGARRSVVRDEATLDHYPVTLTRAFLKRKTSSELYAVAVRGEFRAGSGVCDVVGGAAAAVVIGG
jgi:hypothetical protein